MTTVRLTGGNEVAIRLLSPADEVGLARAHDRPQPPIKDGKRDEEDPDYLREVGIWYQERQSLRAALIAGWGLLGPEVGGVRGTAEWTGRDTRGPRREAADAVRAAWVADALDRWFASVCSEDVRRLLEAHEKACDPTTLIEETGKGNSGAPPATAPAGAGAGAASSSTPTTAPGGPSGP